MVTCIRIVKNLMIPATHVNKPGPVSEPKKVQIERLVQPTETQKNCNSVSHPASREITPRKRDGYQEKCNVTTNSNPGLREHDPSKSGFPHALPRDVKYPKCAGIVLVCYVSGGSHRVTHRTGLHWKSVAKKIIRC